MLDNPFTILEKRLDRLESHLLEIKRNSQPQSPKPDRCTFDEALEITGLSKSTLYKLSASNTIPCKRYAGKLIFSRKELTDWVEDQTVEKNSDDATAVLAASARRKMKEVPVHKPSNPLCNRQAKGNTHLTQLQSFYKFLESRVATASMVSAATGIPQKCITRYKRRLEKAGSLWEVTRTYCKLTGFRASYLTTDPQKAPKSSSQLSLF